MRQAHSLRANPLQLTLYAPTPTPPLLQPQLTTCRPGRTGRQSPTSPDQNQLSPAAPYQRRGGLRKK
jgi:hypothetical protein